MARQALVGSIGSCVFLLACAGDSSGASDQLTSGLTLTGADAGTVTASGGTDGGLDSGTTGATGATGADGGDDGGTSGGGGEDTGPGTEAEWEINDQWDAGRRLSLTNGRYDITFTDEMIMNASDVRLVLDVRSRSTAFEMGMNFNKEIGLNGQGSAEFYTYPGASTAHAIESVGNAAKRITFEFANPIDSSGGASRILGTSIVEVVVRWDSDRLDVDLEHPITSEFGNHNGFTAYFLDQRGFPYTLRLGTDSPSGFVNTENSPTPVEAALGYFVDEQGMLGTYQGGVPSSNRAVWKDYYVVEKNGRSILVYTPTFRDLAVKGTYDGPGYYQNLIRPWGEFVFTLYSQTTLGAQLILAPVPPGDYHDELRLLLDQPTPANPGEYDGWLSQVQ